MKAITLHQPWASLIADGRKRFETRSWAPPRGVVGARIAIHAGKRFDHECANQSVAFGYPVEFGGQWWRPKPVATIPLGAVVCTAYLSDVYLVHGPSKVLDGVEYIECSHAYPSRDAEPTIWCKSDHYGDYSYGRFLWLLTRIERLDPPTPARGRQRLWEWTCAY